MNVVDKFILTTVDDLLNNKDNNKIVQRYVTFNVQKWHTPTFKSITTELVTEYWPCVIGLCVYVGAVITGFNL